MERLSIYLHCSDTTSERSNQSRPTGSSRIYKIVFCLVKTSWLHLWRIIFRRNSFAPLREALWERCCNLTAISLGQFERWNWVWLTGIACTVLLRRCLSSFDFGWPIDRHLSWGFVSSGGLLSRIGIKQYGCIASELSKWVDAHVYHYSSVSLHYTTCSHTVSSILTMIDTIWWNEVLRASSNVTSTDQLWRCSISFTWAILV